FCGGAMRFSTRADEKGMLREDEAAGLVALHSVAGHGSPEDFMVFTEVEGVDTGKLASKARELMEMTERVAPMGRLTPRQGDVLAGVERMKSNKEIARELNISERTVKFHVGDLLRKFGVRGRGELAMVGLARRFAE